MGQYHYAVNLDKREFIHPHKLGCGLKLVEQLGGKGGTGSALVVLLAASSGRGGGDFQSDNWSAKENPEGIVGRWAGDRIALVGDYGVDGDLRPEDAAGSIYARCRSEDDEDEAADEAADDPDAVKGPWFVDITAKVADVLEREAECIYIGDGWRDCVTLWDTIEGFAYTHGTGDRTAVIREGTGEVSFPISKVRAALKAAWPDFQRACGEARWANAPKPKVTLAQLRAHGLGEPISTR